MKIEIHITKHGGERIRKRLGLNKRCMSNGTFEKLCRRAVESGEIIQNTNDELRAVYGNTQYLFAKSNENVLVLKTAITSVSSNYDVHIKGDFKRISRRKDFRLSA